MEKEIVPKINKKEIKAQNKTLRNIFICLGIFLFVIIIVALSINSAQHFKYNGVEFKVIQEGELIFYNAVFPLYSITGKHISDYNFPLRKDPRKLDKIPLKGEIVLKQNIVINTTKEFKCDGDEVMAIANLVKVFNLLGAKAIKDPQAGCDYQGKYTFIQIREGEETGIEEFGPKGSCYNFYVNDCEILEVTEKFIVDLLVKAEKNRA